MMLYSRKYFERPLRIETPVPPSNIKCSFLCLNQFVLVREALQVRVHRLSWLSAGERRSLALGKGPEKGAMEAPCGVFLAPPKEFATVVGLYPIDRAR